MAVFSSFSKVMESDGSPMSVRTALALINQTLDEVLAEQEGEFDADTRWALAWFEQFGMEEGAFGMAETLSKAKNTAVNGLVEAGLVKARGGKVRLLKREELLADWSPATDTRITAWEVTQYLIRALDEGGESGAAELLRKVGGLGEVARDLAYRYACVEYDPWKLEYVPQTDPRCVTCQRLYDRLNAESDRLSEVAIPRKLFAAILERIQRLRRAESGLVASG